MAGTGGSMMAGVLTEGSGQSGFGVSIAGFHAPSRDFLVKLESVRAALVTTWLIAQAEVEGYVTFVAVENTYPCPSTSGRIASYRREPHKFFSELSSFLRSIQAAYVEQVVLTESLGSVQMTLLYRPAPGTDEPGV